MDSHSSTQTPEQHGLGIWWTILVISGLVSVVLNIWHAVAPARVVVAGVVQAAPEASPGRVVLALILGVLPVLMPALLSHTFVVDVPKAIRWIVALLFLYGMAMSVTSQAEIMMPVAGNAFRAWGVPVIVDIPALVSVYMIAKTMADRRSARRAAEAKRSAEREADRVKRDREEARRQTIASRPIVERPTIASTIVPAIAPTIADRPPTAPTIASPIVPEPIADRPAPEPEPIVKAKREPSVPGADNRDRVRFLLAQNPAIEASEIASELDLSVVRARALRREVRAENGVQDATEPRLRIAQ